jgi:hypothetical protein
MPVEFVAFAVYVIVPAPWQRLEPTPDVNTGRPTVAVTVTVCVEFLTPLHPATLAVTTEVPLYPEV